MLRLNTRDPGFAQAFQRLVLSRRESGDDVARDVALILADVRNRGDEALAELTQRFDGHSLAGYGNWRIGPEACTEAFHQLQPDLRAALELAAARIRAFHEAQRPTDSDAVDAAGVRLGSRWRAVDAAGIYIPGGRAAYPSSLLMNAIPARVAGVERLVAVSPTPKGVINPLVLAAAHIAQVDEIWRIGGAQAIAALAYGTTRIAPVDVVTGPGNAWVAEAKRQLYGVVGIDMVAGPSEILVIADGRNDPDWTASDLLSQAEHDPVAQSILITDDPRFADTVADRIGVDSWLAYFLDWRAKRDMRVPNRYTIHPQIPGVTPMLEALSTRYPMAVVTNRNEVTTRAFLDSHNLTRFFTVVLASQSCKHTKPFADPLIAAAQAMDVPVEDCLMIGDTIVDVHAAIAAKAQSLAVLCGFGTEKQLLKAGVQEILPSTSQLAEFLISEPSSLG